MGGVVCVKRWGGGGGNNMGGEVNTITLLPPELFCVKTDNDNSVFLGWAGGPWRRDAFNTSDL